MPRIVHFHILILIQAGEIGIGHAQFLSLVHIRGAAHHMDHGGQHFRADRTEKLTVITVAAHLAGLVMVAQVDRVPCPSLQSRLPAVESRADILQRRPVVAPLAQLGTVIQAVVMFKGKNHIQFGTILIGIADRAFHGAAGFTDSQQVIPVQHLPAHFPEIAVGCLRMLAGRLKASIQRAGCHRPVIEVFLADHTDHVHAPSVHAFVAPPAHHVKYASPYFGIGPVQVRLFLCEKVQVVLSAGFILFPGRSGEAGSPVVGRSAVLSVLPDIVIPVRIILSFPAFNKPGVLV